MLVSYFATKDEEKLGDKRTRNRKRWDARELEGCGNEVSDSYLVPLSSTRRFWAS
jgi:hypothetical protein